MLKKTGFAAVMAVALVFAGSAQAEYPEKPVRMIIPFGQGGAMDSVARMVAVPLEKRLGQPVVIVNRTGAGGAVGTAAAARANPDGYTITIGTGSTLIARPLMSDSGFTTDSFAPVARIASVPGAIAVREDSPYQSMDDLIKAAQKGQLAWTSPGTGTGPYVSMSVYLSDQDAKASHLASKSGHEALLKLLSGEVDFVSVVASSLPAMIGEGGGIRVLGIASDERWPYMPDVKTFEEQGADYIQETWFAVVAPKGTPNEAIDRLAKEIEQIVKDPANDDLLKKFHFVRAYLGPQKLQQAMDREEAMVGPVLKAVGLAK